MNIISKILISFAALTGASASFACSVCGCSLSSDWGLQGYPEAPGLQFNLRYEYFDQTDLRSGTGSVDRNTITFPHDEEIQQGTTNHSVWLGLDYVLDAKWAVSLQLPSHVRGHATIVDGDTDISSSHASGPGDARVIGRYTVLRQAGSSWAVQFGLKLPTGRFNQSFASGPQAGELLDRGLQLGTGTTDVLIGAAWFGRPLTNLGVFVQGLLAQPLAGRDGFSPSPSLNLSTGVRWLNSSTLTPQLQLNIRRDGREHGANADTANSGNTLVYLSPGLTAELGRMASAFAFVQLPVYQRVNGLQLQPRWLLSTGVRWHW